MGWRETFGISEGEEDFARKTFIEQPKQIWGGLTGAVSGAVSGATDWLYDQQPGGVPLPYYAMGGIGKNVANDQRLASEARIATMQQSLDTLVPQVEAQRKKNAADAAANLISTNPAYTQSTDGSIQVRQSDGSVATLNFDDLVDQVAGLIPSAPAIPDFEFDWYQAEWTALEKLTPYYNELLEEANFDMNLAIQRLNEDYDTGGRQLREDFNTVVDQTNQDYYRQMGMRQQDAARLSLQSMENMGLDVRKAKEDFLVQQQELDRVDPEEQQKMAETMSERGMLKSTIRDQDTAKLDDRQRARRQAIDRALNRKEQIASLSTARETRDITREAERGQMGDDLARTRTMEGAQQTLNRGMEEIETPYQRAIQDWEINYPRYVRDLDEQMTGEATGMAQMEYDKDWNRYYQEQMQNLGSYIS